MNNELLDQLEPGKQQKPTAPERRNWSERLLPYLFAAMEACWVDILLIGLASIHLLGSNTPFLPLWATFVLTTLTCWFARLWQQHGLRLTSSKASPTGFTQGIVFLILLAGLLALAISWLLHQDVVHVIAVLLLAMLLCWRGMRSADREIDPANAFKVLRFGFGVILIAICAEIIGTHSGKAIAPANQLLLFFLTWLFLCLSLVAQALTNIVSIRRSHVTGLDTSALSPERRVVQLVVALSIMFLAIALIAAGTISPAFLAGLQQAAGAGYAWTTHALASAIVFVLSPIFWLFDILHFRSAGAIKTERYDTGGNGNYHPHPIQSLQPHATFTPSGVLLTILAALKFIVPILLLAAIVVLCIFMLWRRLKHRIPHPEEQRESIWSWALFWNWLKAYCWTLVAGFFARLKSRARDKQSHRLSSMEKVLAGLTVRDIRVIYRALLKKAARRGYARLQNETPFEFEERLQQQVPMVEPQLTAITEAYVATRYGGYLPDEAEATHLQHLWAELDQQWRG